MSDRREELHDLLVRRALEGLDADEARRLDELRADYPGVDPGWADRVVAQLDAETVDGGAHPLSPELRTALLESGPDPASAPGGSEPAPGTYASAFPPRPRWVTWSGWAMAAVLAGLLLVDAGARPSAGTDPAPSGPPAYETVAQAPGAVVASWAPGGHPSGDDVSGQVAWSGELQTGVMRFTGLAPAPPGLQYQLWVFDATRDERFPVDGGVFDIPPGADTVEVAIDARLPVAEPTLFAVTLEPEGGVVVSDRERLATVAPVGE